ncbi:MAG: ATP-binding protein [Anaerolineales bacterium]|jgi:histidine kinase|nr:ATP-binding protein [Anaerolineales bacterium]
MKSIRSKLLLSYLIILLVGMGVTLLSVSFSARLAYNRRALGTGLVVRMLENGKPVRGPNGGAAQMQFISFRNAVFESLGYAGLTAALVAVLVSFFLSERIVSPLGSMTRATGRIAAGHYDERVQVQGEDELSQLAGSLNQMAEQLEQTENMRRRLIGDVAHELRTPLTTLKGSLEGLIDGVLPPDNATFAEILQESERLGRLVDDLQELSRVEAGAYTLDKQTVVVAALAATAIKRLARPFSEKQIALTLDLPADLPPLQADEDRILQVLTNLLHNALQYTPAAGTVTLAAQKNAEFIQFSVSDSGLGLSESDRQMIFTRFYRADKSRSRQAGGGSGIGLTIAKHLVEAHGGRIWVESPGPGRGSTFFFSLPLFH